MELRITDPELAGDLVRFFRRRGYLAVSESPGVVEVVPIRSASERANRAKMLCDLAEWTRGHPGVEAEPVDLPLS
jgi:hypothetical protein